MKQPMLTTDFFDRAVDVYADVVGVVADDGTEYTYAEFGERVNQLSHALRDLGIEQGDRVALVSGNTHYFLEAQFASQQIGAVYVPINFRLIPQEYEYILNDCAAELIIVDYEFAEKIESIRDDIPCERFVGYRADRIDGDWMDYSSLIAGQSTAAPERPDINEDDDAVVNYTSGTTGDPKGVVRTHRTEHWHALILSHHMELQDDDTYLWTLPMFHCNGWGYTYANTGVGATHVCQRNFDAADTFEKIREYDVTHLCGAPTVLNRLIGYYQDHDGDIDTTGARDVRLNTAGSAPPKATIRTVETEIGWRVIHIYGLTETAPIMTTSNLPRRIREADDPADIKVSQGPETLCTEVKVVADDGNEVPRDGETMGEVVVRGNQVMDRYLNKPDATEEAFNAKREGWFHTGDIATWDENGMLSIQDREKDIIISGGENVSSIEVEDVLYDHPETLKVAVIGIPSDEWGEAVHALVVPHREVTLNEDEVIEFARDHLASYKVPKSVEFVDDLPETATGKVQKYELREEYWEDEERMISG